MTEIQELENAKMEAIGKRIDAQEEIKNIESRLHDLKQKVFVPGWFVWRNWSDEMEYSIEWIDRHELYAARTGQTEFIQRYDDCKHLFAQAPKEAGK